MRVEVVFSEKNDEFEPLFSEKNDEFEPAFGEIARWGVVEDLDEVLTHQEELLEELEAVLDSKTNNNAVIEPLEITENGTYHATKVDGYNPIIVNVPIPDVGVGTLTKYAKIRAKPESTTSFTIENPLGGIARKACVQRTTTDVTSTRKIQQYIVDTDLGIGAMNLVATDGGYRYATTPYDSGTSNGKFEVKDGVMKLYRYNSANTWDTDSEYEVEIYE